MNGVNGIAANTSGVRFDGERGMIMDDMLVEVKLEAVSRFARRANAVAIVSATLEAARELLAGQPAITDYIIEMAMARGAARANSMYLAA